MTGLFTESDFRLFGEYAGKTQAEAPEGQGLLRPVYDKLGTIAEGLEKLGYGSAIKRMPLMQGGPGVLKYAEYHWSRIYPKEEELKNQCWDKVFVVVGTNEDGINIHIDSYQSKGYACNSVCDAIKNSTWEQIPVEEAVKYTHEKLVEKVDRFFTTYWKEFNQFAKEFKISESIKILEKMAMESIKNKLIGNYNLILTGAPGTGKTYLAKGIAQSMGAKCKLVQFHPSYDYTDFVEGLRPVKHGSTLGFERRDGAFKSFCKEALLDKDTPHVFIIDEINRGEISKIFGELFYAIDPGYIGHKNKAETQYQNLIPKEGDPDFDPTVSDVFRHGFFRPENVYIIGTMNDIDRSVESMDFAMRRRFAWQEISAKSRQSMLDDVQAWNGNKPEQEIIDEIKNRMDNLNACIIDKYGIESLTNKERIGLTTAYQIGASYFLKYALYNNFDELWSNHIEGLLYEYLRGTTNTEAKIQRLHTAYNDTDSH